MLAKIIDLEKLRESDLCDAKKKWNNNINNS